MMRVRFKESRNQEVHEANAKLKMLQDPTTVLDAIYHTIQCVSMNRDVLWSCGTSREEATDRIQSIQIESNHFSFHFGPWVEQQRPTTTPQQHSGRTLH
eukprot:3181303-Amphidinium_carterae.1